MALRRAEMQLALALLAGVLLLWLTAPAAAAAAADNNQEVYYNRDAAQGEFPYQVSLQKKWMFGDGSSHRCGAVVLDERHALTAGHCVNGVYESRLRVVAGVTALSDNARVAIDVQAVFLHEHYDDDTYSNDIALVRLEHTFPLSSRLVAPVPLRAEPLRPPAACVVTGWGDTRQSGAWVYPDVLQALEVPLLDFDACQRMYEDNEEGDVTPGMLCVGFVEREKDACHGDSGGLLVCQGQLTGLGSWGDDCAKPGFPGVYTDVAYYKGWLEATLAASYQEALLGVPAFVPPPPPPRATLPERHPSGAIPRAPGSRA